MSKVTEFDKLFNDFFGSFTRSTSTSSYPPYNVIRVSEQETVLEFAVAGFAQDEIKVDFENDILSISGKKVINDIANYVYKGIGTRSFERKFTLDKNSEVQKAELSDGILSVHIHKIVKETVKNSIPITKGTDRLYLTERDDIV